MFDGFSRTRIVKGFSATRMRCGLASGGAFFRHAVAGGLAACAGLSGAAGYPERPVRMIVGYAAGAGQDITGRFLAQKLSETWGQQVIVDNRPGAGSSIAGEIASRATPDGYTLLLANEAMAINATLQEKRAFDPTRDFAPVSLLLENPRVIVAHAGLPADNVKELVGLARAKPGAIRYGSSGIGTGPHLAAALLASMAKVEMTHVPYKGVAPALTDVLGGQIQVVVAVVISAYPHLQSGRLKALAVTTAKRTAALPNVATVAESGYPGYEATAWTMLLVPARIPGPVLGRLHADTARIIDSPEARKRFAAEGGLSVGSTPAQAAAYLRTEIARWAGVIQSAGIRSGT